MHCSFLFRQKKHSNIRDLIIQKSLYEDPIYI